MLLSTTQRIGFLILALLLLPFGGAFPQTSVTIGSGTQSNGTGDYPAVYGNFYEGAKHQFLIRASELSNAGLTAGTIDSLGFDVEVPSGNMLEGFTILMKQVNRNSLSSFDSNLDTALYPIDHTPGSGWDLHDLDSNFLWDGSSDILIETCFNNPDWDQNDQMVHSNVGYDATLFYRADNEPDLCQTPGAPSSSTLRPNVRIVGSFDRAPVADFQAHPTLSCNGTVDFEDRSDFSPATWKWYFGDGDSSSAQNPTHTYSSSGTYTVELIVSNSNGSDTLVKTNYVDVNLSGPSIKPASCTPQTQDTLEGAGIHRVSFNTIDNASQDAASEGYKDFTCQGTSLYAGKVYTLSMVTDTPTTHNAKAWIDYDHDGSFDPSSELVLDQESVKYPSNSFMIPTSAVIDTPLRMRVMADYDFGTPPLSPCQDPQYGQAEDYYVRIEANPFPPEADFEVSDTLTCDGSVQFNDLSRNAPDAWKWYFGDGDSSSAQNPDHTYDSSGTYTVTLVVQKGADSDTLTLQDHIRVNLSGAVKAPACRPKTLAYCCDYGIYEVDFEDIQRTSGDASEGYRDFSCGSHTELREGENHPIEIRTGTQNPHDTRLWIDLDSSGTFESDELLFESLNNNHPSGNIQIPCNSVKDERLRMRVTSDFVGSDPQPCKDPENGQTEDYSVTIRPNNDAPVADFSVDSSYTCTGTVEFRDSSRQCPTDRVWDFGDGTTDTVADPTHTYDSDGSYTVSLTISNSKGSDTVTKENLVIVNIGECPDTNTVPQEGHITDETCYGTLMDDGGMGDYSNETSGAYTIHPPNATSVKLSFKSFTFEPDWDSLIIYDGPSTSSPRIGVFDGVSLPGGGTVISSGPAITVQQKTDFSRTYSGFLLEWSCSVGLEKKDGKDEKGLSLKTFPNPASERLMVRTESGKRLPDRLRVLSSKGRTVRELRSNGRSELQLDVRDLAAGLYLIQWKDPEEGPRTERFVVQDR